MQDKWLKRTFIAGTVLFILIIANLILAMLPKGQKSEQAQLHSGQQTEQATQEKIVARITGSGDMLYHAPVYRSAYKNGTYDFSKHYAQITPLISSADLALGDFEGTISSEFDLAGYPLFNAPIEVVDSIKKAGFDVIDLAHNHILDSRLAGVKSTIQAFKQAGLDTFGVKEKESDPDILIKDVKGIKVAILGYAYGFNGMESTLSTQEYNTYLKDLSPEKVKADIEAAEKQADITIVMPQMGEEYRRTPTEEQQKLYRQMIDWGADIIFGGHPHVIEPTEIIEKDGEQKFIIYSMGNLLSNQRFETLEDYWTERGVIVEVEITKENQKTRISDIILHPTWVSRTPLNTDVQGYPAYDYQVFLAEDYLDNGKYVNQVDENTKKRIQTAYKEAMELMNLQFKK
ncbi:MULTISPECIES: CapA family protein [unclassified Granulicatella]|uniref:CapA family protein n=1 Tax=unclassified Granulicatella TaxID=2630493 RepID=UPI0010748B4E|nr:MULTISPECIES: CapA family protein [unclassified Granulicatella]MBF0779630.1 CapA family protein [Granulicatella sp. 19428wC4_WM01]TFU96288.1 CapA family protein [Granulicatella sp. WM01]